VTMQRLSVRQFDGSARYVLRLALATTSILACEPKVYPNANQDEIAQWEESTRDGGQLNAAGLPPA
jgi:hypothetical protein